MTTELKQYLYQIRPTRMAMLTEGATPEESEIVGRHFEYLKGLTEAGIMILVGRTLNTDDSTFGIAVFKAASEEEAAEIMNNDPAVKEGVMRAQLFPYRVALISESNAR